MISQPNYFGAVVLLLFFLLLMLFILTFFCFSNGPDDVGRWQRATFKFFFFFSLHIQGTSIGLAVTNHALLSLVDTNLT